MATASNSMMKTQQSDSISTNVEEILRGEEPQSERIHLLRWLAVIVLLMAAIGAIGVAVGAHQDPASGRVLDCYAEPISAQDGVLAVVHVRINNTSRQRIALRGMRVEVQTSAGRYDANASSLIDYQRYTESYAMLRMHAGPALDPDMTIEPGATADGSVLVNFPVTLDQFDSRQSISAVASANDNLLIRIR